MSSPSKQSSSSSSSSQSPPRKRVRSSGGKPSTAMIGETPSAAAADRETAEPSSASPEAARESAKMKLKVGRRHSSNNANANFVESLPNDEISSDSMSDDGDDLLTSRLLRKVPKRPGLSASDQEVVRLIGQHLTNIGLKTSADVLMQEAGCRLDQPTAATFKRHVMNGDWILAVKALDELKDHLENPSSLVEMKYLLLEQKYLEFLSQKNRIEALKVLQTELTPLKHNQDRTHELSSFLMLSKPEDILRVTRPARQGELSRSVLMDRLQTFLPASIMLPPRRLATLLQQAAEFQTDRCLYHNKSGSIELDASCLAVDHQCSKQDFPYETMQVLTEHCEEVWYCRFSPNGLKLATGSKDMSVIIWDFDPDTLSLKCSKTLERHTHGVSYFAWSPDSSRLAVCGPEDCDEVCLWNVDKGEIEGKISHSTEDSLTTVSWSPDGQKIACGGNRGNFYQCDTKGVVNDSWEGVRVQCLQYRKDGKTILAADTHHRVRSYNFEELSDFSVLQEDHGIMSFTLDESDRYALLNIANQGIHLWDIEERCLIRKFTGITQGFYTIYSCFGGGPDQNFVASGSEDNKVYIYHVKRESPIVVLSGHSRTVNCVAWNPVYPRVLVSASDDCTVRVWGPSKQYRHSKPANSIDETPSTSHNHSASNGVST